MDTSKNNEQLFFDFSGNKTTESKIEFQADSVSIKKANGYAPPDTKFKIELSKNDLSQKDVDSPFPSKHENSNAQANYQNPKIKEQNENYTNMEANKVLLI